MRSSSFAGALVVFGGLVGIAMAATDDSRSTPDAVDYSKMGRALVKVPAYQTKAPMYALLIFGPQAKLHVWVVLDGREVYLDRNGDGDLTGKDEKFKNYGACRNIELSDPDGKTRYNITRTVTSIDPLDPEETGLFVEIEVKGPFEYRQYCECLMAEKPASAAIAHFHGPLTMFLAPPGGQLKGGEKAEIVGAYVGTIVNHESGERVTDANVLFSHLPSQRRPDGSDRTRSLSRYGRVYVRSHVDNSSAFPKGVAPVVDVEFPAKTPIAESIAKRYPLRDFCCGGCFLGPVSVPGEAGLGKAKVTFSFDAWKEGRVAPATMDLPVVNSSAK